MAGIREKRTFFSLFCCFVRQTSDGIIIIYSISSKRTLGFFFPPIPENNSLAVYLSTPGFHLSLSLSVHERIRTLVVGRLFFFFLLYFHSGWAERIANSLKTISRPADKRSPGNARRHKGLSIPISHRKQTLSLSDCTRAKANSILYIAGVEREREKQQADDMMMPALAKLNTPPSTALVAWRLIHYNLRIRFT